MSSYSKHCLTTVPQMRGLLQARCRLLSELRVHPLCYAQRRYLKKLHPTDPKSKYDKKVEEANRQWGEQASTIRNGDRQSTLSLLESRGLVNAIAGDRNELDRTLTEERIGAYVGIDPTASSMHLGHLLPMMALLWMYVRGYEVVALLGGATAAVGDPSGRLTSRKPMSSATRRANIASMHMQLKRLWKKMEMHATQRHGHEWQWGWRRNIWNNSDWLNKVSIYEFMSQIGNGTRLGPLLSRDTIKNKIENGDGVTFSELAYPLLQGFDWWYMFKRKGISLQIGGADQFGNIISGMDSVNHLRKHAASYAPDLAPEYKDRTFYGITVPLLTTSAGEKFGKSVGNAIWLDEDLTSPMELYQFLLRTADEDVERFLRLFTLLEMGEINILMEQHNLDRSRRIPQRRLAQELVTMIHSATRVKEIEASLGVLYSSHKAAAEINSAVDETKQSDKTKEQPFTAETPGGTRSYLPYSAVEGQSSAAIIYAAGFCESRSEANRLITAGGAYVGGQPDGKSGGTLGEMRNSLKFTQIHPWPRGTMSRFLIDGKLLILRSGKWRVKVIEILPDEEFQARKLPFPRGWDPHGQPNENANGQTALSTV